MSEYSQYESRYGNPNNQISPEYQWQHTQALQAGQDVMDGKYGKGMPQLLGAPGAAGGGAGGGGLGGTYQNAQDAYNAAQRNSSNLINKGYSDRVAAARGMITGTSGGVIKEINDKWNKIRSEAGGDFDARGLLNAGQGNTKSLKYGQHEDLTRAEGEILQRQAQLDASLTKDGLDYRERDAVRDTPPDVNQMIGLEQGLGAGNQAGMPGPTGPYQRGGAAVGNSVATANPYKPRIANGNLTPAQYYARFGKLQPGVSAIPGDPTGVGRGVIAPPQAPVTKVPIPTYQPSFPNVPKPAVGRFGVLAPTAPVNGALASYMPRGWN